MLGIYFVSTDVGSTVVIAEPEEAAWLAEPREPQLLGWAVLDEHSRVVQEVTCEQKSET